MSGATEARIAEGAALASGTPLRGTQSFVGVVQRVWKRPGLTALEVLWRWSVNIPLLLLAGWAGSRAFAGVHVNGAALEAMTVFRPVEATATLSRQLTLMLPPVASVARWWVPLALAVWCAAAAVGRTLIWRRLNPELHARVGAVMGLLWLRNLALLGTLALWVGGIVAIGHRAVIAAAAANEEPNLVLFAARSVGLTLLLFLVWTASYWVLDAAPLFAMRAEGLSLVGSVRAAWRARTLGYKLIEINFVMSIVRVGLLVLATVASASPLPFESVATPQFLEWWWCFVMVIWLVASNLFQVVRRAAYLWLFEVLVMAEGDTTRGA